MKNKRLDQDPAIIVILPFSPFSFFSKSLQPALNSDSVSENPPRENAMGGTSLTPENSIMRFETLRNLDLLVKLMKVLIFL